jgi:hypothetical protein
MTTIKEAKQQADRVTLRLKELGIIIKRAYALEAVAAFHNQPDWNHLVATLEAGEASVTPSANKDNFLSDVHKKFSDFEDSRITMLCMSPGNGKTTMLLSCLQDAIRRGENAVFIDCAGSAKKSMFPESMLQHCTFVDVTINSDGYYEPANIPESVNGIVVYNARFSIPMEKFERVVNQARFYKFIENVSSSLPERFTRSLRYVLIDEFSRTFSEINVDFESLFNRLFLANSSLKLIISSQMMDVSFAKTNENFTAIIDDCILSRITNSGLLKEYLLKSDANLICPDEINELTTVDFGDEKQFIKNISVLVPFKMYQTSGVKPTIWKNKPIAFTNNSEFLYFENFLNSLYKREA